MSGKLINSLVIRERDQVMLKVQVVEVQRAVLKQLGVTFNGDLEQRRRETEQPAVPDLSTPSPAPAPPAASGRTSASTPATCRR